MLFTRLKKYFVKEHFEVQTNKHKAALLFKRSVRHIDIEISSYCNRVCAYCPNAFVELRSAHEYIEDGILKYLNIISPDQLQQDYRLAPLQRAFARSGIFL